MAEVLKFHKPLMLRYCDKPECPRCKPRHDWTINDYNNADEKDKQWMVIKGFRHDSKTA